MIWIDWDQFTFYISNSYEFKKNTIDPMEIMLGEIESR